MEQIHNQANGERLTFHYYGYPGCYPEFPRGKVGTCPVEIRRDGGKLTVIITEPEEMETTSVTNVIENIATKIYYYCLQNERPESITWMQHDIKDIGGRESICEVKLKWDGKRYIEPDWCQRKVIADYRVRYVKFEGDRIQLHLGFEDDNHWTATLKRSKYPRLKDATLEQLERVDHCGSSYLDWYQLGFRLHVRTAVLEEETATRTALVS